LDRAEGHGKGRQVESRATAKTSADGTHTFSAEREVFVLGETLAAKRKEASKKKEEMIEKMFSCWVSAQGTETQQTVA
jgi:hypothetical protein